MASIAAMVFYLFLLAGEIGLGYFVWRLSAPDARLEGGRKKVTTSSIYALVLVGVAFALDYYVSADNFLEGKGILPITLFATAIAAIVFFKIKNMLFAPKVVEVGVPTQKIQQHAAMQSRARQKTQEKKPADETQEDERAKQAELRKIHEAEIEEFASQIAPKDKSGGKEKDEVEADGDHRRYLKVQEEQQEKVQRQKLTDDELDAIATDIYKQLRVNSERATVGDKLKVAPPAVEKKVEDKVVQEKTAMQTAQAAQAAPAAASSTSDRLSAIMQAKPSAQAHAASTAPQASGGGVSLFDQLSVITAGPSGKTQSDVKMVKVAAPGTLCPHCRAANSKIIFCPYCGSGMCANCSPLIKPMRDGFEYTCPKCGESVFVKKGG